MKKKAVITGIGVVSPLGIGHQDFWNNLVSGNSAIAPMECLIYQSMNVRTEQKSKV